MPALLIVCPIPEHHKTAEQYLSADSWEIRHATSCCTAIAALKESTPGAILCEHELPDGTWRDILKIANASATRIAVVVSSPVADDLLWAEVLNEGGYDVIEQPMEGRELTRILEAAARPPISFWTRTA